MAELLSVIRKMAYFQKFLWTGHPCGSLDHLNEFEFIAMDKDGIERKIIVTFSDHCFTRSMIPGDDPALRWQQSGRIICPDRYHFSRQLPTQIRTITTIWNLGDERCALISTKDHLGNRVHYSIIFTLDPVRGLPADLHMRIRSAHLRNQRDLITFGELSFRELISLRLAGRHPRKITDKNRKKPACLKKK